MQTRTASGLAAAAALLGAHPALAQTPTVDELWQLVQRQQAEIEALQEQLESTGEEASQAREQAESTAAQVQATADFVEAIEAPSERRTTIGGYGELHYNNLDAADPANDSDQIDLHRFVLFVGHRFTDNVRFFSELEIEHSLAGDGAPGEVELEQAYVDFRLGESHSAKAGLFLVPIGILNETHEPPTFYGVERNDVENIIVPTTWWEAGGGFSGNRPSGLSWDLAVHSGLAMPTTGGSAFRVRSGRQKVAEALASDWASTGRVRYTGIPGLDLAASLQYQSDPSQVAGDGLDSGRLLAAHAVYRNGPFELTGLYGRWDFDGAAVEAAGVDRQTGWYIEPAWRLNPGWGVYARYEDLEGARLADRFTEWEAGFNYWPVPNVVFKFDYRERDHDEAGLGPADFDGFDLGLGYQF